MKTVCVIPSNRRDRLREFLAAWSPFPWDGTIVVYDGPEADSADPGDTSVYTPADIRADLGDRAEAISVGDSGIRSYGFWKAVTTHGADVVLTLDDDCYPIGDPRRFTAGHLGPLQGIPRWTPSIPGQITRGYPYQITGHYDRVIANMGLWTEVGDYDAPQTLAMMRRGEDHTGGFEPGALAPRLMPAHQYWPLCGMNLAFRADVAPLFYFPKMGEGSPYRRFDDIWCGVIAQKACAHLGLGITVGGPAVRHVRASNPYTNLEKEAAGIRANERFWEVIDGIPLSVESTPLGCMRTVGHELEHFSGDTGNATLNGYLPTLGGHILTWCALFGINHRG